MTLRITRADLDGLKQPHVRVWSGQFDGETVATAALAGFEEGHEELKSMRTSPEVRGRGFARRMLEHVLADARARGVRRISLETGAPDFFVPARTLYARYGFVECEPFGDYVLGPYSVFMTLEL